jgi:hypothetical protein
LRHDVWRADDVASLGRRDDAWNLLTTQLAESQRKMVTFNFIPRARAALERWAEEPAASYHR